MKTKHSKPGFHFGKTALVLALGLILSSLPARATLLFSGVDLKDAGRTTQWALFALTGGITIADTTTQVPIPAVVGNIGVSANSITLSGTTKVQGSAYIKTGGTLRRSGTAFVTGNGGVAITNPANDVLMNKVKQDAIDASAAANALANYNIGGFSGWNSLTTVNQNTSLSLTDGGNTAHVVLHLTDFVLSGGAILTLDGNVNTTYVFNISNNFSLIGGKVVLTGGIAANNVLFNVTGSGTNVTLTSLAEFNGYILANNRTVNISAGSKVDGMVIAGKVSISGGGRINHTTYASP